MDLSRWLKNQWDRTAAVVLAAAALAALLLGWFGVSRVSLATEQIPFLASGGLIGLFLAGAAGTLWLSADLRDEWRKLDDLHDELRSGRLQDAEGKGRETTMSSAGEVKSLPDGRSIGARAGR